jgi:hypothetical protein
MKRKPKKTSVDAIVADCMSKLSHVYVCMRLIGGHRVALPASRMPKDITDDIARALLLAIADHAPIEVVYAALKEAKAPDSPDMIEEGFRANLEMTI